MAGQCRLQAQVVEGGGAELAGEHQQLLHRLVGERLRLGELVGELDRRLDPRRLEAQQQRGQRLVHLVVEVAARLGRAPPPEPPAPRWRCGGARHRGARACAGTPAAAASPPRARLAVGGERRLAPGRERSARSISSTSRSSGRKRRWSMITLTRIVSATAKARISASSGCAARFEAGVAGDRGHHHGDDDQQQVGDQDLGEEVLATHRRTLVSALAGSGRVAARASCASVRDALAAPRGGRAAPRCDLDADLGARP